MGRKKTTPVVVTWSEVVPPPEDPLAQSTWLHDVLARSAYMIVHDPSLKEAARRRELRETAATMRGLVPQTRLGEAERLIRGEADDMAAPTDGPVMEHASRSAKGSGRPAALRGRPRKR